MAFYPIVKVPNFFAKTTLFNFAPNNWEISKNNTSKFVNASWAHGGYWHTESILFVDSDGYIEVTSDQAAIIADDCAHIFLSMSENHISQVSLELPDVFEGGTSYPQWRASMQIFSHVSSSSYLGEISPFPPRSSCLSFGGMMQPSPEIKNFIIFMNLEFRAIDRAEVLEVHNSITGKLINKYEVKNNSINLIELDQHGFGDDCLPVVTCKSMGGIPLYFSHNKDFTFLSLEHTHPPSSFVVHGNRNAVQSGLKKYWFQKCE